MILLRTRKSQGEGLPEGDVAHDDWWSVEGPPEQKGKEVSAVCFDDGPCLGLWARRTGFDIGAVHAHLVGRSVISDEEPGSL